MICNWFYRCRVTRWDRIVLLIVIPVLSCLILNSCTSRAVTVTSLPPGAEVSINRTVVGKTPIRLNYTHYGDYRIELRKDRYEPRVAVEAMKPPVYGYDPFSFVADNVLPARISDETSVHYILTPVEKVDRDSLLERAAQARTGHTTHPITGKTYEVALADEIETPEEEQPNRAPGEEGPAQLPNLAVPEAAPEKSAIKETRPEGPKLSTELGIKGETKGPETKKPDGSTNKTDDAPRRMRRTPKGEVLIYDEDPIEDPDKK